jgi:hypothetical protein
MVIEREEGEIQASQQWVKMNNLRGVRFCRITVRKDKGRRKKERKSVYK